MSRETEREGEWFWAFFSLDISMLLREFVISRPRRRASVVGKNRTPRFSFGSGVFDCCEDGVVLAADWEYFETSDGGCR